MEVFPLPPPFIPYNSVLQSEDLHHTRGVARSGLPPLSKTPYCCLP